MHRPILCFFLAVVLAIPSGCQSPNRVGDGTGENQLLHEMAEPTPHEEVSRSTWGDQPLLKPLLCVGLVVGLLACAFLMSFSSTTSLQGR
jgi:hypothetical protein